MLQADLIHRRPPPDEIPHGIRVFGAVFRAKDRSGLFCGKGCRAKLSGSRDHRLGCRGAFGRSAQAATGQHHRQPGATPDPRRSCSPSKNPQEPSVPSVPPPAALPDRRPDRRQDPGSTPARAAGQTRRSNAGRGPARANPQPPAGRSDRPRAVRRPARPMDQEHARPVFRPGAQTIEHPVKRRESLDVVQHALKTQACGTVDKRQTRCRQCAPKFFFRSFASWASRRGTGQDFENLRLVETLWLSWVNPDSAWRRPHRPGRDRDA